MNTNKPAETLTTEHGTIKLSPDMIIMLNMSRVEFIETNKAYLEDIGEEFYNLLDKDDVMQPLNCPLHLWVIYNKVKCIKELVSNTAKCPLCGNPTCPDCMNHKVDQISRVTGYLSTVSGWGAAKKQEFADRHKYDVSR